MQTLSVLEGAFAMVMEKAPPGIESGAALL